MYTNLQQMVKNTYFYSNNKKYLKKTQISYLFSLFVLHFVSFILLPMNSVILSNLMYMYTDCTFLIEFIIDKNITKKKT
jgi:pilus assembly protein TadC